MVQGAGAPTSVRALRAEASLLGDRPTPATLAGAVSAAVEAGGPITDRRVTGWCRRQVLPAIAAAAGRPR